MRQKTINRSCATPVFPLPIPLKRALRRVQERPLEAGDRAHVSANPAVHPAIQRVADHRMADCAQVDANLMRAAGEDGDPPRG